MAGRGWGGEGRGRREREEGRGTRGEKKMEGKADSKGRRLGSLERKKIRKKREKEGERLCEAEEDRRIEESKRGKEVMADSMTRYMAGKG